MQVLTNPIHTNREIAVICPKKIGVVDTEIAVLDANMIL